MHPRIGLYFDFRNPAPWHRPWTEHYASTLEFIEEADRRGIGSIWVTEHHFFDDGYLPQPLTMAAAIAARTRSARLGTAIVIAPFRPAVQMAEDAALIDILSSGRFELGIGAGYVRPEFDAFGADIDRRYHVTDERIAEVRRLLDTGAVAPGPVQDHLPLWAGYLGPRGARRAGRLGVGLLHLNAEHLEAYRAELDAAGHGADTARMGGLAGFLVADDPDEAFERVLPHLTHQLNSYRANAAKGTGREARMLTTEEVRGRGSGVIRPLEVLTADEAVARIRGWCDEMPVEHVYVWASVGGMPQDLVERQMELLVDQVIPALGGGGDG